MSSGFNNLQSFIDSFQAALKTGNPFTVAPTPVSASATGAPVSSGLTANEQQWGWIFVASFTLLALGAYGPTRGLAIKLGWFAIFILVITITKSGALSKLVKGTL